MISYISSDFRKQYKRLPRQVRLQADKAYRIWKANPYDPKVDFKLIKKFKKHRIHSAKIGRDYRAMGRLTENEIIWFWIGSHEEYNRKISQTSL